MNNIVIDEYQEVSFISNNKEEDGFKLNMLESYQGK